ncbi:MAG: nuclear transport factor 2 family protein [Acidimicrobiaceae bacterium]|nr:nuclear transport factor 2 family protein [Acidimicrobiaceae bacterium]
MKGFDPRYEDLPDYILGITYRIWEGREVDALRELYAPDITVRSPDGVVKGNEAVIAATLTTLAQFGDRQLLGEDVIWSGDDETGFLSSHRIMSLATHSGDGTYGRATGTKVRYRIIADCAARENQIYDEWLVRDQGAIVRQLGLDPKRYAAEQIDSEGGPETCQRPFRPSPDAAAAYTGAGNDHETGRRYADLLERVMDGGLDAVAEHYDRAVQVELPGGCTAHGQAEADRFWLGLRSSFSGARFEVHHRIGRDDPGMPPRAALRWSLTGTHDGWGAFGRPSGAPVHVMGISHAEFGSRGLRREWVLIDETAIWKQILLHTG